MSQQIPTSLREALDAVPFPQSTGPVVTRLAREYGQRCAAAALRWVVSEGYVEEFRDEITALEAPNE